MFFDERIISIKPTDRVLEIGPGGTPHPRSDIYLDIDPKYFKDEEEALLQRGSAPALKASKPIIYYDGLKFPFDKDEFDYIICSHVLEHVTDVKMFMSEIFRVGKAGYIEYPTIFYDYIYNIPVHKQLLHYNSKDRALFHMAKGNTSLSEFQGVQKVFLETLSNGYSELIECLKEYMFEGFEWREPFTLIQAKDISQIVPRVYNKILQHEPITPTTITTETVRDLDFSDYGIKRLSKELLRKIKRKATTHFINQHSGTVTIQLNHPKIDLEIDDSMKWCFSELEYYEKNVVYWFDRFNKNSSQVIYDIGANYGLYSIAGAVSNPENLVYAFEPTDRIRNILKKNIEKNGVQKQINIFPYALSNKSGESEFNVYSASGNNSLIDRVIPEGHELKFLTKQTVRLARLDDLVKDQSLTPPTLLKIDVEGAELMVLEGAKKIIKKYKPSIIIEYSAATSEDAGYNRREIYDFLVDLGYEPFGLSSDNISTHPIKIANDSEVDNLVAIGEQPISNEVNLGKSKS